MYIFARRPSSTKQHFNSAFVSTGASRCRARGARCAAPPLHSGYYYIQHASWIEQLLCSKADN